MSAFGGGVAEDDDDSDVSSKPGRRRRENRQKLSALASSEYRNSGVGSRVGFGAASPMVCSARMRAHTCSLLSLP